MILSFDVRPNSNALDTLWPIVANKEAIAVNQNWAGSVGALVKTWNPQEDNASAPECGNFDIVLDHFPRGHRLFSTPYAPRALICSVPMLNVC